MILRISALLLLAGIPALADLSGRWSARLPDGKPDFSGIWHAAAINQCVPGTGAFCGLEIGGSPLALNIGKDLPGGLPYQPWAAEPVKQRFSKDDPHVCCLPDNPPRMWGMPHLTKAIHTPRLLVLLHEVNAMYRQIFIDGRPRPENPNPSWNGYSTATWDPWTVSIKEKLELDTELIDEICLENEKSWQHMQAAPPVK